MTATEIISGQAGPPPASAKELLAVLTAKSPKNESIGKQSAFVHACIWVNPELVAEIEFLEWTESDHPRHAKFVGLREDKDPRSVVKERSGGVLRSPPSR